VKHEFEMYVKFSCQCIEVQNKINVNLTYKMGTEADSGTCVCQGRTAIMLYISVHKFLKTSVDSTLHRTSANIHLPVEFQVIYNISLFIF
jgi:hypothetical protein